MFSSLWRIDAVDPQQNPFLSPTSDAQKIKGRDVHFGFPEERHLESPLVQSQDC